MLDLENNTERATGALEIAAPCSAHSNLYDALSHILDSRGRIKNAKNY